MFLLDILSHRMSVMVLLTTLISRRYRDCSALTGTTLADTAFTHPDTPIPKTTWDSESPVPTPHHRGRSVWLRSPLPQSCPVS